MLNLTLRDEFKGERLKGTTIDFSADDTTGVLKKSAADFLDITYPSVDLLKVLEAAQPDKARPIVLLGGRGQGKSHLMASLYHAMKDPAAAAAWLAKWSAQLGRPELQQLKFRSDCTVIGESLHLQHYKFLWDILFALHPKGEYIRGKWEALGAAKPNLPGYALLLEMFRANPTALLLDEFQTWFDGLSDSPEEKVQTWAFNFIQLLSEIASKHPDILVLVVSIRDNQSEAFRQVHRVQPVLVDFQGAQAKKDRQRLLLYRVFNNRINVPLPSIAALTTCHVDEHLRLAEISPSQHETTRASFVEAWPFSPVLMSLLEDQVLVATQAQETRDLIRILVDLFKSHGQKSPVITAAAFDITSDNGGIAALLTSVANPFHRSLLQKAQRNLEAVNLAVKDAGQNVPHASSIISALWLRSLSVDRKNGAEPHELQVDITGGQPVDDNAFAAEMALIRENSFNIHPLGSKLVFKEEENAEGKLLAHAKNDKLFETGQDVEQLAAEIRYVIGGSEDVSRQFRVIVLRKKWQTDPWSEFPESERPDRWESRLTIVVLPEYPDNLEAVLGKWLKDHLPSRRNTLRFLLPKKSAGNLLIDRDLFIYARAVKLADEWKDTDGAFRPLHTTYQQSHLRPRLRELFDSFALLDIWNFAQPEQCRFLTEKHNATGDKIPQAIQKKIENELFATEDFEAEAMQHAVANSSLAKFIAELQEPRINGKHCIPWLGDIAVKERVLRLCAAGKLAINVRDMETLQAGAAESEEAVWQRIKGKLGNGRELEQTTLQLTVATPDSGGTLPLPFPPPPPGTPPLPNPPPIGQPQPGPTPFPLPRKPTYCGAPAKTAVNLLGEMEKWGILPATALTNVNLNISSMTGAQLDKLLKGLPADVNYGLNLEKEEK